MKVTHNKLEAVEKIEKMISKNLTVHWISEFTCHRVNYEDDLTNVSVSISVSLKRERSIYIFNGIPRHLWYTPKFENQNGKKLPVAIWKTDFKIL